MAESDGAGTPPGQERSLLLVLRESGDALEAASLPFDVAAGAARLHEAARMKGLLRADEAPGNNPAVTDASLEEEAPPFDLEAGAARLWEAAHTRGLLSAGAAKDCGPSASRSRERGREIQRRMVPAESRVLAGQYPLLESPSVITLVARAVDRDKDAWNEIIERYAPLIWSICMRYRLGDQDVEDVGQTVWLLLVEQIGKLREPAALPGWLATTTQRECLRVLTAARKAEDAVARDDMPPVVDAAVIEQEILAAERNAALRTALGELPLRCQQLLTMLISDPPHSYAEISATLQIPIGSIGPQRVRCLERLRRSSALARLGAGEMRANSGGQERA